MERSKMTKPAWSRLQREIFQKTELKEGFQFVFLKSDEHNVLQGAQRAEVEGKSRMLQLDPHLDLSQVSVQDLYYEGKLDYASREKIFDIYVLFSYKMEMLR